MRDINLIPREYALKKKRPLILMLAILMFIAAVSAMVYLYMIPQRAIKELEQEISDYDEVVVEYNILKNKLEQMQKNEELIRKKLEILDGISTDKIKPTEVIELVKGSMPQDVLLTNLSYNWPDVSLTCIAGTSPGAAEFYVELGKLDEFKNVKISTIVKDDKGYNFTIQFSMAAGSDEDEKN